MSRLLTAPHGLRETALRWWPRLKPWAAGAFILIVLALLASLAWKVDWAGVWEALQRLTGLQVAAAAGLTAASFATYGCFDLVGRHQLRLPIRARQSVAIAATSYAFNLNIGAMVGGFGLRYRLYSRLGVELAQVTQVIALSMLTNWLGYFILAGACFTLGLLDVPERWAVDERVLRVVGVGLLVVALAYLAACARWPGRRWHVRTQEVTLPGLPVALAQAGLSMANWMLIAAVIFTLLPRPVTYLEVLAAVTVSSIAGIVSRIPAGLGVAEAVFVALFGDRLGDGRVLAAVLAYRAVYYLLPLMVALLAYLRMEAVARQKGA